jgi:hypothetical protein
VGLPQNCTSIGTSGSCKLLLPGMDGSSGANSVSQEQGNKGQGRSQSGGGANSRRYEAATRASEKGGKEGGRGTEGNADSRRQHRYTRIMPLHHLPLTLHSDLFIFYVPLINSTQLNPTQPTPTFTYDFAKGNCCPVDPILVPQTITWHLMGKAR